MSTSRDELIARFADLADDHLIDRLKSGTLTDEARSVAEQELRSRGVDWRSLADVSPAPQTDADEVAAEADPTSNVDGNADLIQLVAHLDPTEAHILRARLASEDIYAAVANESLQQQNWFMGAAAGGARVLVAQRDLEKAKIVLIRLQQGEYRLRDEDEAPACPRCGGTRLTTFIPGLLAALFKYSGPAQRCRCENCGHTWPNSTSSL